MCLGECSMEILLLAAALLGAVVITASRPAQLNLFGTITGTLLGVLAWFGDLALFCTKVVRAVFTRPFEGAEFLRQFDSIGAKSLPLVALAGAATGVVLSMQTRDSLSQFGAKSMLPA